MNKPRTQSKTVRRADNPGPEGVLTMPSAMQVQPYLIFEGRCEEAVEFYRSALGAEVTMLMRFKEACEEQW